jgi:hypothetical protein
MIIRQQPIGIRVAQDGLENAPAISPSKSRSRFFVKVVGAHTASSIPNPTNQRNSRL